MQAPARILWMLCLFAGQLPAQWTSSRADGHAPIGVMGDHRHEAGEVMLSYRFMAMRMAGSRVGTDPVSDAAIVAPGGPYGFMVTPTEMPMQMHMVGAMFAPSDRVTLIGMAPFVSASMAHLMRNGNTFETRSSGLGDVSLGALIGLAGFGRQAVHATAAVRAPTGSIDRTDATPMSAPNEVILPYPMQTGSGSWAARVGLTYLGQGDAWSWGAQAVATVPLGDNNRDYKLGSGYAATVWTARRVGSRVSVSARAAGAHVGNIRGADPDLNPALVPTADPDLRAGTRIDLGLGINLAVPRASGLRFAVEALVPLHQDLDGPQLETDWVLVAGIQIVPVH